MRSNRSAPQIYSHKKYFMDLWMNIYSKTTSLQLPPINHHIYLDAFYSKTEYFMTWLMILISILSFSLINDQDEAWSKNSELSYFWETYHWNEWINFLSLKIWRFIRKYYSLFYGFCWDSVHIIIIIIYENICRFLLWVFRKGIALSQEFRKIVFN